MDLKSVLHDFLYNPEKLRESEQALKAWQRSDSAWVTSNVILASPTCSDEEFWFVAQTLKTKVQLDFVELPLDLHENLLHSLLSFLSTHINRPKTLIQLSLAVAALSVQKADSWLNPVETVLGKYGLQQESEQSENERRQLILLLLKHLAEENGNSRILVDPTTRNQHWKILNEAKYRVLELLEHTHQHFRSVPVLRTLALDCWCAWIGLVDLSDFYRNIERTICFNDSFELLMCEDISSLGYAVQSSYCEQTADIMAADSLTYLVRGLEDCNEDNNDIVRNNPEFQAFLLNILRLCISNRYISSQQRRLADEDYETLDSMTNVQCAAGIAVLPLVVTALKRTNSLQPEYQTLLKLLLDMFDAMDFMNEETRSTIEHMDFFWYTVQETLLCQVRRDQQANNSSTTPTEWVKPFLPVYEALLSIIFKHCCVKSSEHYIFETFHAVRRQLALTFSDTAQILGVTSVLSKLSHQLSSQASDQERIIVVLDAVLHLLNGLHLDQDAQEEAEAVVSFGEALLRTPVLLTEITETDTLVLLGARSNAMRLVCKLSPWMEHSKSINQEVFPPQLLEFSVKQSFIPVEAQAYESRLKDSQNTESRQSFPRNRNDLTADLVMNAVDAVKFLSIDHAKNPNVQQLIQPLCNLAVSKTFDASVMKEVRFTLLQAVSSISASVVDSAIFLETLSALCHPSVEVIKKVDEHPVPTVIYALDCLSIVLKNAVQGVRRNAERGDTVAVFVKAQLWPALKIIILKNADPASAEKAVRCLKHSVRCIDHRFRCIIPDVVETLLAAAESCFRNSFLYCAEYLGAECRHDPEMMNALQVLFDRLGERAFGLIDEHKNSISEEPALVEDAYGMVLRYLNYGPLIPARSPVLLRAIHCLETCASQDHHGVVSVVYTFIDSIISFKVSSSKNENQTQALQQICTQVKEYLPRIICKLFQVIESVPSHHVVSKLSTCLRTAFQHYPQQSRTILPDALAQLPTAVVPTQTMKDIIAKTLSGSSYRETEMCIEDLVRRCKDYRMRKVT